MSPIGRKVLGAIGALIFLSVLGAGCAAAPGGGSPAERRPIPSDVAPTATAADSTGPVAAPSSLSPVAKSSTKPVKSVDLSKIDLCRWMDMALEVSSGTGGWPVLSVHERSIHDPMTRYKITGAKGPSKLSQGSDAQPDIPAGQELYTVLECSYTFAKGKDAIGLDVKLVNGPWLQPSDDFFVANPDTVFRYGDYRGYGSSFFLKVRLDEDLWLSIEVPSYIDLNYFGDVDANYRDALAPVARGMLYTWDPDTRQPIPENQTGD